VYIFYFHFFFSSRRRHTRFSRDWSSDVCSSDLKYLRNDLPNWKKSLDRTRLYRAPVNGVVSAWSLMSSNSGRDAQTGFTTAFASPEKKTRGRRNGWRLRAGV